MCFKCTDSVSKSGVSANHKPASPMRRRLLSLLPAAAAGSIFAGTASAQPQPPKPANQLTPDQALERLMQGNERYVSGKTSAKDFASTRAALSAGQNPYACLLSCADSRVGPEFCFDESRGDLFVTRVAGNYVTTDILGSLEYAVAVLGAPLIMVLGHSSCGAVSAAISAQKDNAAFPGHIQVLASAIAPAVRAAQAQSGEGSMLERATRENVRLNAELLAGSSPVLRKQVEAGKLKVVGGIYHLDTGRVEVLA